MNDKKQTSGHGEANEPRSPQVGALLRASRLRVGEDLREIADALCIRYLYLDAIEECRYAELPGDTYAIGFIRSYAEHLGLDGEEVVRRYRAEQAVSKRSNDLSFPTPVPESGVPKGAIVFIGVLLALLIYGGWYVSTTDEGILSDLISPVPDHLKHMVTGDDAATGDNTSTPSKESDAATQMTATSNEVAERTAEAARAAAAEAASAVTEAAESAPDAGEANTPATSDSPSSATASTPAIAPQSSATATATETPAAAPTAAPTASTTSVTEPAPTVAVKKPVVPPAAKVEAPKRAPAAPAPQPETAAATTTETPVTPSETPEPPSEAPAAATDSAPVSEEATPVTADAPTATAVETETATETPPTTTASTTASGSTNGNVTAEDLNALSLKNASGTLTAPPAPSRPPVAEVASVSSTGMFVRANDSSWVEIRNPANGRVVYTGLMSAGTTFKVPNEAGLLLDTGNAGGLDIIVDGTTVPKIGGVGAVRKGVALDAERLKAGTAVNR